MATDPLVLRQALQTLSRDERLICIWMIAGFSTQEIAEQMGRSEAAVGEMFANAKRKLRRHLRNPEARK